MPQAVVAKCGCCIRQSPREIDRPWLTLMSLLMAVGGLSGCASLPYQFGSAGAYRSSTDLQTLTSQQIERGEPHQALDTVGWIFGIPNKIILWDWRVENHRIGSRTETAIADYLAKNELSSVKVRLNQYHPGDDWRRLAANKSVGAGWRYTLGTLSVLGETIIAGRVFGGDHYNPFTNTVHLYSDVPSVALHEAGHSKDFARRTWKGTYAAAYLLPIAPLYHEAKATNDALGYVLTEGDLETQREAYRILYPAYGTYVGSALGGGMGWGYVASVLGGHVLGRIQANELEQQAEDQAFQARLQRNSTTPAMTASTDNAADSQPPRWTAVDETRLAESAIEEP